MAVMRTNFGDGTTYVHDADLNAFGAQINSNTTALVGRAGQLPDFSLAPTTLKRYEQYHEVASVLANNVNPPGAKISVLAESFGTPGVLTNIWFALNDSASDRTSNSQDTGTIRLFFDDDTNPACVCPINDFFVYVPRANSYSTERVGHIRSGSGVGGYRYFWAPFTSYMRVELENDSTATMGPLYTSVGYGLDPNQAPQGVSYAVSAVSNTSAAAYSEVVLANITGAGQVESITLSVASPTANAWAFLEGNMRVEIDGQAVMNSSGTEDFFGGSWYMVPVGGYPMGQAGASDMTGVAMNLYRFFPRNPIVYNSSLKVVYPVGQKGQNDANLASTYYVTGTVSVWNRNVPTVSYKKANRAAPIVQDNMAYSGALSSSIWLQPSPSSTQNATGTGTSISFPEDAGTGSDTTYQDMRAARQGLTLGSNYWIETKMRWNGNGESRDAGLVFHGPGPDPWFGSMDHISLLRTTAANNFAYQVICKDDWDQPVMTQLTYGNLWNIWVWLAAKVVGNTVTGYFRLDTQTEWVPVGTFTSTKVGTACGVYSWRSGVEFAQFNVYPLA